MKLTSMVIYDKIKESCPGAVLYGNGKTLVYAPMLYDNAAIRPGYAYVMSPEQVARLPVDCFDILVICNGLTDTDISAEMLCIPEAVSLPELLNQVTELFQEFEDWDEALCECSSDREGIKKMMDISAQFFGGALHMVDSYYNYVAVSDSTGHLRTGFDPEDPTRPSQSVLQNLVEDPVIYQIMNARGATLYHGNADGVESVSMFVNMFREGETSYCYRLLLIRDDNTYAPWHSFALEHLASRIHRISGTISSFDVFGKKYINLKDVLIKILDDPQQNQMVSNAALQAVSWSSEDRYEIWVFYPFLRGQSPGSNGYILSKLEQTFHSSCAILAEDSIILLRNVSRSVQRSEAVRDQMAVFLKDNLYKVGISRQTENFYQIRSALFQAKDAFRLGSARHPHYWYYKFEDYVLDYMMLKSTEDMPASMLCQKSFLILRDYDAENHTQYLETIRMFIAEKYNATHAAAKLFIHRTTFLDRMERIRALTNLDLNDWDTQLHLMLSYKLLENKP